MPQSFGPYVLQDLLGRGGMGEVYRAWDTEHEPEVALKLLPRTSPPTPSSGPASGGSALTARLREPHVVPIHRYGEIDGDSSSTCAWSRARTWALLRRGGPSAPTGLAVVEQVAAALDAAHADGLVHRDVKPSNVLLTGRPATRSSYLVDFGIARSTSARRPALTQAGSAVGTFDYMAPERFARAAADPRVDVYALACVLYECLTGRGRSLATACPR